MGSVEYRYELRQGEQVVATGHFSRDESLEVEERLEILGHAGIVRAIEPVLGEREPAWSSSSSAAPTSSDRNEPDQAARARGHGWPSRLAGEEWGGRFTLLRPPHSSQ